MRDGRAAARHQAQRRKVPAVCADVLQQAVPDSRDGAGDGGPLGLDQPDQRLGLQVTVRHDQRRARQHSRVRQTPGVGVEHRDDRQHPVGVRKPEDSVHADGHRVQVHRAVAVNDALRDARSCRWCSTSRRPSARPPRASRRRRAARPATPRRSARAAERGQLGRRHELGLALAGRDDDVPDRRSVRQYLDQQRNQRRVDDHDVITRVVGDIADDLRVQPEVQGVQDRAHGRDRQVGLEVLCVVPHQGRHALVPVDAERPQGVGELGSSSLRLRRVSCGGCRYWCS